MVGGLYQVDSKEHFRPKDAVCRGTEARGAGGTAGVSLEPLKTHGLAADRLIPSLLDTPTSVFCQDGVLSAARVLSWALSPAPGPLPSEEVPPWV